MLPLSVKVRLLVEKVDVLADYCDEDGLIDLNCVLAHGNREFTIKNNGLKIYIDPIIYAVSDFIFGHKYLSKISKLRFNEVDMGLKRLPIFGVSFAAAIEKAMNAHDGYILKSMFRLYEDDKYSDFGYYSTLVVHIQKTAKYIQLEAWQLVPGVTETFYIHGMMNVNCTCFTHLDGATMYHDENQLHSLFEVGVKEKGVQYTKHFRCDGTIDLTDAISLVSGFFPIENLSGEYFVMAEQHEKI